MGPFEVIIIASVSFISVVLLNALAPSLGLLDIPSDRKIHSHEIPLVGGLAIYIATLCACFFIFPTVSETVQLFLISCGLIVVLGSLDDKKNLGVPIRLLAQILITSILVFYSGHYLHYLGDILSTGKLDLGVWGMGFTFVATLSLINAFNWNDGIDGLAGCLALNTFVSIAVLCRMSGDGDLQLLSLILAVSVIPFVLFNLGLVPGPVKKVFLGDAGSMFIGLGIIWLFVLGTQGENPAFKPVTAVWIAAIPLWDLTSTFYRRIKHGQSPFKAGNDHLHHLCLRMGLSQRQTLGLIMMVGCLASVVGVAGEYYLVPEYIMLAIYVALFFSYSVLLTRLWKRLDVSKV